jgi:hypothetical protein
LIGGTVGVIGTVGVVPVPVGVVTGGNIGSPGPCITGGFLVGSAACIVLEMIFPVNDGICGIADVGMAGATGVGVGAGVGVGVGVDFTGNVFVFLKGFVLTIQ